MADKIMTSLYQDNEYWNDMNKAIGKRIKDLRKQKPGLTQDALAVELDCERSLIASIETGRTALTIKNLIMLAEIFDVSTDYILYGPKPTVDQHDLTSQQKLVSLLDSTQMPQDFHRIFLLIKTLYAAINEYSYETLTSSTAKSNDLSNTAKKEFESAFQSLVNLENKTS